MKLLALKRVIGKIICMGLLLQSCSPIFYPLYAGTQQLPATQTIYSPLIDSRPIQELVIHLVEDAFEAEVMLQLSADVRRLYKKIIEHVEFVPVRDLIAALPEVLHYAIERHTTKITENKNVDGYDAFSNLLTIIKYIKHKHSDMIDGTLLQDIQNVESFEGLRAEFTDQLNFRSTFTALHALKNTLTIHLADGFHGTCTELQKIESIVATGYENITEEIVETRTAILTSFDNLGIIVTTNFAQVLEELEDIKDIVTICCAADQTNFNSTFTALQDIKNTLTILITNDFNGTYTAIAASCTANQTNFNGTFTTLAACCATNQTNFNGTFTVLQDVKSSIDSVITSCGCTNTITQENIGSGGTYVISQPGVYCLTEDILFTTGTAITISSSDVTLKLNNHTITGSSGTTGIYINGVSALRDIHIMEGAIKSVTYGIYISNTLNSSLKDLFILSYVGTGFVFNGSTQQIFCENCEAQAASTSNTNGFSFASTTQNCYILGAQAFNNQDGFTINGSGNLFLRCLSSSNGRDGFRIDGSNHILRENAANSNIGNGFNLLATLTNTEVRANSANKNTLRGFNDATATIIVITFSSSNLVVQNMAQNNTGGNYDTNTQNNLVTAFSSIASASSWSNIGR